MGQIEKLQDQQGQEYRQFYKLTEDVGSGWEIVGLPIPTYRSETLGTPLQSYRLE